MKNKTKANQVHITSLQDDDLIQIIHMNDYFGNGIPQPTKPIRVIDFITNELRDLLEEGLSEEQAFDTFLSGSGDGDENFSVVTVINGEVHTVVPTEVDRE